MMLMLQGKMTKSNALLMMVMMPGRECVWARINYGRSNQVIMQSRQQPPSKKLITAPDRSRRRGEGGGAGAGGEGERGGEGEGAGGGGEGIFWTSCAMRMYASMRV